MNNLPKVHEKEALVRGAENDLRRAIFEVERKYEFLTTTEILQVILGACNGSIQNILKYAIRQERHDNTNKPGGHA